jgi:FkbM family methyltransferase
MKLKMSNNKPASSLAQHPKNQSKGFSAVFVGIAFLMGVSLGRHLSAQPQPVEMNVLPVVPAQIEEGRAVALRDFPSPLNPNKRLVVFREPKEARNTKIWIHDPAECKWISGRLDREGAWEAGHQRDLIAGTPPGGLFMDIGGNIGTFSLVMASAGFRVVAFEPLKYNLELFRQSIKRNGFEDRIKLHEVAAGEKPVDRVCLKPAHHSKGGMNTGNGQIRQDGVNTEDESIGENCVPLIRPDSVISECPDAVKVDVEGWEGPALRGLGVADGKCLPKIITIEHQKNMAQENPFVFLLKNGYECTVTGTTEKLASAEQMDKPGARSDFMCRLKNTR